MARKWHEYFAVASGKKEENLLATCGAFIMLLSLILPWHYVDYRLGRAGITGVRLLLEYITGEANASLAPALASGATILSALYILFTEKAVRAVIPVVITAALIAAAMFSLSVQPERFGPGLYLASAGLCAAAIGSLAKL